MDNDNPTKNLLILAAAVVLLLLGVLLVFRVIGVIFDTAIMILPWALIIGGIYLVYRWWTRKS